MLVECEHLTKYFPVKQGLFGFGTKKKVVHAVDGVTFGIRGGETLGLVGESGCGKTTTGRLILRLLEPTCGTVRFMNRNIFDLSKGEMRKLRRDMQIIFQDPFASLNPRKSIRQILGQPYKIYVEAGKNQIESRVLELLETVGLSPPRSYIDRYPHEFSGGQRQRIGIARAIALRPKFIVADEPVSALDMSVRAQILNLMKRLQKELKLTYLFIAHDLSVIRSVADRVIVMYLGKIVELSTVEELYDNPQHPYTKAILSATPIPNPRRARGRERVILKGEIPSPIDPPSGCRFHTRCPQRKTECAKIEPDLTETNTSHFVACHLYT